MESTVFHLYLTLLGWTALRQATFVMVRGHPRCVKSLDVPDIPNMVLTHSGESDEKTQNTDAHYCHWVREHTKQIYRNFGDYDVIIIT